MVKDQVAKKRARKKKRATVPAAARARQGANAKKCFGKAEDECKQHINCHYKSKRKTCSTLQNLLKNKMSCKDDPDDPDDDPDCKYGIRQDDNNPRNRYAPEINYIKNGEDVQQDRETNFANIANAECKKQAKCAQNEFCTKDDNDDCVYNKFTVTTKITGDGLSFNSDDF